MTHPMLATIALVALTSAAPGDPPRGGWWGDLFEEKVVPLEKILKHPDAFRGITVSFIAQFHEPGEIDNPFFTKFESEWYVNFSVWPDGVPLWQRDVYKDDFEYMFVRRSAAEAREILAAPLYSRWLFVAEVSDTFKGEPWIEVKGIERLEPQMNEASLIDIVKGFRMLRAGRLGTAAAAFRAADRKTLPIAVRVLCMHEEAMALHRAGKTGPGVARLEMARLLDPDSAVVAAALAELRRSLDPGPDGTPSGGDRNR